MDVPTVEFIVLSYPIITLYDLLESEARTSGRPEVPSVLRLQIKQKPGVLENRKASTLHFLLAQHFYSLAFQRNIFLMSQRGRHYLENFYPLMKKKMKKYFAS